MSAEKSEFKSRQVLYLVRIHRVITLSGVNQNQCVEVGVDFTKEHIGDADYPCFFENNFGEDKVFPGGLTCAFKGKIVPCFVR